MILFIDDDDFGMKPYRLALEEAGLNLLITASADEALSALNSESNRISLIILDVLMPSGSVFTDEETNGGLITGYRLLEKIRKSYSHIPILILSITNPSEMRSDYATDNVAFLSKQNTLPAELLAAVRERLP